jgi:ComF family protein
MCHGCEAAWPALPEPRCERCAGPLDPGCADCDRLKPAYTGTVAVGAYAGVLREALHALKYRRARHLAAHLADRLAAAPDFPTGAWLVVPVPTSSARLKERGYNQAALLGRAIAKRRRLPYAEPLRRIQETAPQHALTRQARLQNLAGAFACGPGVAGRPVLLVDDVMTSGATVQWATLALLAAGASEVRIAVVARTLPPGMAATG